MNKSRFSEEQIIGILREGGGREPDKSDLCSAAFWALAWLIC